MGAGVPDRQRRGGHLRFLGDNGASAHEERIKLAFVCLLAAVGISILFAGDEFGDEHHLAFSHTPE
ncbi:MAG TPA: hypothetical protein VF584_16500 [Longimicrobium sp.]|jgi:hypothetical protein